MSKLEQILEQKMTRRQFIVTLGLGIVGLLGIPSLMSILSHNQPSDNGPAGYGLRSYGP